MNNLPPGKAVEEMEERSNIWGESLSGLHPHRNCESSPILRQKGIHVLYGYVNA